MVRSSGWCMLVGPIIRHRQNTSHMRDRMRGSALLFGWFILSGAIYMVAHLLWLSITNP
jgi:uncharacterized membrane protein